MKFRKILIVSIAFLVALSLVSSGSLSKKMFANSTCNINSVEEEV